MDEETESDRKKKERRIDLSIAQVAGSALAAAIAAFLAGRLGVYGTIIGAGVVSVVATTGGSIFQHLFRRTGEQLKEATVTTRPKPRRSSSAHPRSTTGTAARAERAMVLPTFDRDGAPDDVTAVAARTPGPDPDRTRLLPQATQAYRRDPAGAHPAPRSDEATRALRPTAAVGADRPADRRQLVPRLDERTMALGQAPPRAADATAVLPWPGETEDAGRPEVAAQPAEVSTATYGTRLRGWRRPALGALAVFAVAMGAVTGTELMVGTTPDGQQGTTLGHLTGVGGAGRHQPGGRTVPEPDHSTGDGTHGGRRGEPSPDPSGSGRTGSSSEPGDGTGSPTPTPSDGGKSSPGSGSSPSGEPSPDHSSGSGDESGSGDGSTGGQDQGGQSTGQGAEQGTPAPDPS
ncbi:hypothetical protein [Streptomyces sp. NPDC048650]|uniref:hypothetical protein n=1 Tax=unclassified Streptomyces TaxID=2593676 RepID=UPI003722179E